MASRYQGIARHLAQQPGPTYTTAFRVMARATGHPRLRDAAYTRPLWWTNDPVHPQARHGWLAAGWRVETVDLVRQVVGFRRDGAAAIREPADRPLTAAERTRLFRRIDDVLAGREPAAASRGCPGCGSTAARVRHVRDDTGETRHAYCPSCGEVVTLVEPADCRGFDWQPPAATEREALIDRLDAFLAERAPTRPEGPTCAYEACPTCGTFTVRRHDRDGVGGVDSCPGCGWEGAGGCEQRVLP